MCAYVCVCVCRSVAVAPGCYLGVDDGSHDLEDELDDEAWDEAGLEVRVDKEHEVRARGPVGEGRQRHDLRQVLGLEPRALRRRGREFSLVVVAAKEPH